MKEVLKKLAQQSAIYTLTNCKCGVADGVLVPESVHKRLRPYLF
jgi:hypothetical protein